MQLAGQTKIPLVNGTYKTVEELYIDSQQGIKNWGYSLKPDGKVDYVELSTISKHNDTPLIKVIFESGQELILGHHDKLLTPTRVALFAGGIEICQSLYKAQCPAGWNNFEVRKTLNCTDTQVSYSINITGYDNVAVYPGVFVI